uniref:Uncharacterized protein n=1 Tax=Acrobeloides nanus TaxID=290746 RepID=A0A914CK91_9BILA
MVCVPCIILPVLLAIYLKFIQPFIMRFVPEAWKVKLDAILYPTCPVKAPPPQKKKSEESNETSKVAQECACDSDDKKEN